MTYVCVIKIYSNKFILTMLIKDYGNILTRKGEVEMTSFDITHKNQST